MRRKQMTPKQARAANHQRWMDRFRRRRCDDHRRWMLAGMDANALVAVESFYGPILRETECLEVELRDIAAQLGVTLPKLDV